ncbi:hypothetical protein F5887DRAFT_924568 [Amanita rubescens]|nr:hypothetical protein F5887DRAFT_924568 [Amanita rubescens]
MDIDDSDVPMTLLPSPMPSSSFHLSQAEADEFKEQMKRASESEEWSDRLFSAGSDKKKLQIVLVSVVGSTTEIASLQKALKKNIITFSGPLAIRTYLQSWNDDEVEEWRNLVQKEDWVGLVMHRLGKAYTQQFIGDFATKFIKHIERADLADQTMEERPLYAKAISVVQSSGTGKSRMLTEVGKQMFTLPVCLRKSSDIGYPPGDEPVVKFFSTLSRENDLSPTAHAAIACFLAAAHETMLETLQKAHNERGLNGQQLLEYWHGLIEPIEARNSRKDFFTKVVERANTLKLEAEPFAGKDGVFNDSPTRGADGKESRDLNPGNIARHYYGLRAKKATEELMEFLSNILPEKRMSIMYFDEAQELGSLYWVFLRLVENQPYFIKMWYAFMGTKSRISDYAPPLTELLSARLKEEISRILPPYIDLGFDQQVITKSRAAVTIRMRDMETIKFISQYGRPMWSALLEVIEGNTTYMASFKLLNGQPFDVNNKDHVFAVLSQRLCLDLVLTASKAIKLADRSVEHHMRLLTGIATNSDGFYTHSPSEPVLVMGSIHILYNTKQDLGKVLDTLSRGLCGAGLVEKGIWGELCVRTLLLIARDFAAPLYSSHNGRNYLKPVRLMSFLDKLFGGIFDPSDRQKFDNAFGNAFVNFTHWISTQDPLPGEPNQQILANLWARGGALQCCFFQEKIVLLLPVYHGSVDPDSIFDPSLLSSIVAQIKFKTAGDGNAELAIRPIGVVRDLDKPLPYLAILMELGCEKSFKENGKKIKYLASEPLTDGTFRSLCEASTAAAMELKTNTAKEAIKGLKKKANDAQLAVDSYNRYSISVRGASPDVYKILREAKIVKEFATLLSIVMPEGDAERTRLHMRPLEHLSEESPHADWMWKYRVSNAEEWKS